MSVALDDPLPLLRHVFPTASGDEHGALAARLAAAARWRFCRLPLQQLGAPDDAVDASVDWGQQVVVAPSSSDRPACLVFCRPWAAPARPATLGFEASFFKLQVSTVQLMVTPLGLAAQPGYMLDVRRARDRGTGAGALHAAVPRCSDEGGEATHDLLLTLPSDQSSACLRRLSTHVGVESSEWGGAHPACLCTRSSCCMVHAPRAASTPPRRPHPRHTLPMPALQFTRCTTCTAWSRPPEDPFPSTGSCAGTC